jgi:Flp pilus assembly pilin Flp
MKRTAVCLLNEEGGQGVVEYSLILSLIVIGLIAIVSLLGKNVFALYLDSIDEMP